MVQGTLNRKHSFHRSTSDENVAWDDGSDNFYDVPATEVLKSLTPQCEPVVFTRLRREGINNATDLAGLDKEDLRDLGLTMLERSRVWRWAKAFQGITTESSSVISSDKEDDGLSASSPERPKKDRLGAQIAKTETAKVQANLSMASPGMKAQSSLPRRRSQHRDTLQVLEDRIPQTTSFADEEELAAKQRLDEVEQRADFWCSIVTSVAPLKPKSFKSSARPGEESATDLRENVLEELFDLSMERVEQLYYGVLRQSPGGNVSLEALRRGLHRCGLPCLTDGTLTRIISVVSTAEAGSLGLAEFEAILSRLKLAQLLTGSCRMPLDQDTLGGRRVMLGDSVVRPSMRAVVTDPLTVVDYCPSNASVVRVPKSKSREFFFGHRKRAQSPDQLPLVRWVHMSGLDLTILLALTVKYGLHPLCVEDVIEQCPSKVDRYGCHYFAAIQQLCLVSPPDGSEPVRVHGAHVAIFCSGPPLFDTILTVAEPDHDEKEDWPGGPVQDSDGAGDAWVERLKQRLQASHSRIRERRADFLMYQVLDLGADELVKVTNAYTSRLSCLEEKPLSSSDGLPQVWLDEVSLAQLQLVVVGRRLKGLQRLIRRVSEDEDLSAGLSGYVADVKDHIDEAHEDVLYLIDKCRNILEASERALDRNQQFCKQRADDELNSRVFILTVATAIFAPMHFLCAVYGMNFQIDGTATIPELLWPRGYAYFWAVVLTYVVSASTCTIWLWRRFQRKVKQDFDQVPGAPSGARADLLTCRGIPSEGAVS